MKCGGFSPEPKEITDNEQSIIDSIKATVESGIGKTFTKFKGLSFKSQVVAGTNYHFKVECDDDIIHLKVFRPLPHTNLPPQLSSYEIGKKLEDEL
jgi:cystatin-A/B